MTIQKRDVASFSLYPHFVKILVQPCTAPSFNSFLTWVIRISMLSPFTLPKSLLCLLCLVISPEIRELHSVSVSARGLLARGARPEAALSGSDILCSPS